MTPIDLDQLEALLDSVLEPPNNNLGRRPLPWRVHDHTSMDRFVDNPDSWMGYAWVGAGGDSDGGFDGSICDLDCRSDGSMEWRKGAATRAELIAKAVNALPNLISAARRVEKVEREKTALQTDLDGWRRIASANDEDLLDAQNALTKAEAERDTERRISAERWTQKQELLIQVASLQAQRDEARAEVERLKAAPKEKRAPVQGYTPGIPWAMHLRAHDAYRKQYGAQQALLDLEGRNCRGGFGTEELDVFIPGWREELSEITALQTQLSEAQSSREDLQRQVEKLHEALRRVRHTLQVPAAEYVPAIPDAWTIIDGALK